jgi:LytTr DNA-binding domain
MANPVEIGSPLPPALGQVGTGRKPRQLPFGDWDWRHYAFYFGVPAVFSLYAALNNWAVLQVAGYERAMLFYAGHGFVPWWVSSVITWVCLRSLAPWRPHQIVVLTLGSVLACVATLPYAHWITEYFARGWLTGDSDGRLASEHIFSHIGFWAATGRATVIWVAINLVFDRFLGLPRYRLPAPAPNTAGLAAPADSAAADARGEAAASIPPADDQLRFLQRLPTAVAAGDVIALKAEQHYIRVYTTGKSFLTLYRFSDALAEFEPGIGCQVHRSYWVRYSAMRALHRRDRKYFVELVNDAEIPISAGNIGMIREIARTRGIPVHPPL